MNPTTPAAPVAPAPNAPMVIEVTKTDKVAAVAVAKVGTTNKEGTNHGLVSSKQMGRLQWLTTHAVKFAIKTLKEEGITFTKVPEFILSVDKNNVKQLAHYKVGRDSLGLAWRIEYNLLHLGRSEPEIFGTLVHEVFHGLQHALGTKTMTSAHHDQQFVGWCNHAGNETNERGIDMGIRPGSPIVKYMRKSMKLKLKTGKAKTAKDGAVLVAKPLVGPTPFIPPVALPKPAGTKMHRWACDCTNIRVAIEDFEATCNSCGADFVLGKKVIRPRTSKAPKKAAK
jgi:hypothetical protein